jgi:hypothetical protein
MENLNPGLTFRIQLVDACCKNKMLKTSYVCISGCVGKKKLFLGNYTHVQICDFLNYFFHRLRKFSFCQIWIVTRAANLRCSVEF